jgi:hypothetical protein
MLYVCGLTTYDLRKNAAKYARDLNMTFDVLSRFPAPAASRQVTCITAATSPT